MRIFSLAIILVVTSVTCFAQETANFSQFFVNPYAINPSFAGVEGKTGLYLTYRHQWADFDGAPRIGNLSFHTAATKNLSLGLNFNNDRRSVLNTSSALLSLGYNIKIAKNSFIRFGISGGGATNMVDINSIRVDDPAFFNALDNNAFLLGNAGLSLHVGGFHLGVAIPQLFEPQWVSDLEFSFGENFTASDLFVNAKRRYILSVSNRFYFGDDKHVFEPYFLYRVHEFLPPQMEAAAIVHLNHTLWFGGTYKQDFGISGTAGIKTDKLGVGYSYTFKNLGVNKIVSPTHEVTVSLLFGNKKEKAQKYSFVSTVREIEPIVVPKEKEPDTVVVQEPVVVEEITPFIPEEIPEIDSVVVEPIVEKEPVVEVVPEPEPVKADVTVKKGGHEKEIPVGNYVVVGVFSTEQNAQNFVDGLYKKGYQEAQLGYITERGFWYVYVHKTDDPSFSRNVRNKVRGIKEFKDAWTLEVHD
ncbi:MAG: PorP/SprF family type IX secretion system membrane protein [Cyclobacteriaceae bacterium]|nr:PorP/SprF family type IX secretion system membrane protein [Cyclobacteriaceae bacterium]